VASTALRNRPNTALEATGHSVRFVAGEGLYRVARASAWAIDANSTKQFFQGTGKIGKRDIEVTAKVNADGELAGDFGRDFEREATVEIIKLAVKSTLKAAVKTTIGGEAAIKGTFEILYLIGYELKQI
jgi:hypothetical protein